jgi:hypothetical protein
MNFENIRYYFTLLLLVLGTNGLYAAAIVWVIRYFIPMEGMILHIAYIVTYIILCSFWFCFLVKKLRGVI